MEESPIIHLHSSTKLVFYLSPMEPFTTTTTDHSLLPFPPIFQPPPPSSSHHDLPPVAAAMPASRKRSLERTGSLQIERDRRSKMSHMFAELQSTVPGLFSKVTREVIVNETINYIKHLENKKRRLEELKACSTTTTTAAMIEPTARTTTTSNNKRNNSSITVTLSASNVAFFGIQSKAQPGLLTRIFKVFFNHNAEILAANVSVNNGDLTLAITALLPHNNHNGGDGNGTAEKIKTEILSL